MEFQVPSKEEVIERQKTIPESGMEPINQYPQKKKLSNVEKQQSLIMKVGGTIMVKSDTNSSPTTSSPSTLPETPALRSTTPPPTTPSIPSSPSIPPTSSPIGKNKKYQTLYLGNLNFLITEEDIGKAFITMDHAGAKQALDLNGMIYMDRRLVVQLSNQPTRKAKNNPKRRTRR